MQVKQFHCPIEVAVNIVGGKWKLPILYQLFQGTKRYGELKRLVPAATERMLTLQLRELEQAGIVQRVTYPEVPPKVEYSLTEVGLSLKPVLQAMLEWSEKYLQEEKMRSQDVNSKVSSVS